jgi:hypothetical protein
VVAAVAVSGAAVIRPSATDAPSAIEAPAAAESNYFFEGCGELFQGVECVLFAADAGGVYLLENLDGFGVGDRVLVSGILDPDCFTICLEGDGCIVQNTIEACDGPGPFAGCGELVQGVACVLFQADLGGLFLLENLDGFDVGDRVFVAGALDPDCFTICLEGDGCIFENVILSCDEGEKVTICHIPPGNPANAHEITVSVNALPAHLAHGDTIGPCQAPPFEGCGTLVQGVECVLFQADAGGLYLLENLDGFGVGDRVFVTGVVDPDCVTICLEGDGCIFGNTIEACVESFKGCGELIQGVECVLFQADAGGLYLLENLDGFGVGDRVFVSGILDPTCFTICLQEDACIFGNTIEACVQPFEGCGTLIQGVECVLFQADVGGLYLLENLDGFGVGDQVFVTGVPEECFSICQEEDACIFGNTIEPCVFEGCGTLVQGVECVLFQAAAGGLYLLDNLGSFGVGDEVFVTGILDPNCFTICLEGDGCIFETVIGACR